jgi:small-conductance mechanosensitive channel
MWLAITVGLLTILYAVFMRPMRQNKKDPLAKPPGFSLSRQRTVEKQMETLLVELSEMARQMTAQIDTRAARLEALLKKADETIAALGTAPPPRAPQREEDQRHAAVYALADSGLTAGQIAQRLARPEGEIELILALRSRKPETVS